MKKVVLVCENCKKEFSVWPCQANGRKYCNPKCYDRYGSKNPKWRGGRIIVDEYVYIYIPSHDNATDNGYVCEHRLVMENSLGRLLSKGEVVHHIDGNKQNNKIENLKLVESTGKHFIQYHLKRDLLGKFSVNKI